MDMPEGLTELDPVAIGQLSFMAVTAVYERIEDQPAGVQAGPRAARLAFDGAMICATRWSRRNLGSSTEVSSKAPSLTFREQCVPLSATAR